MSQLQNTRRFLVGGNWKCNGTRSTITDLCSGLSKLNTDGVDIVVAPVSLHLSTVQSLLKDSKINVSCQNVSSTKQGAFTGEIAAEQLVDFGLSWTIVGHSERRKYYGETDDIVTLKIQRSLLNKLNVIGCLGETETERNNNKVEEVVTRQLKAIMKGVSKDEWANMVIAYEPVWAIGTGNTCSPKDAQTVCAMIRNILSKEVSPEVGNSTRILYGGSVKPKNAAELISEKDIDGFLVGGASLKADSFGGIIKHVQEAKR